MSGARRSKRGLISQGNPMADDAEFFVSRDNVWAEKIVGARRFRGRPARVRSRRIVMRTNLSKPPLECCSRERGRGLFALRNTCARARRFRDYFCRSSFPLTSVTAAYMYVLLHCCTRVWL